MFPTLFDKDFLPSMVLRRFPSVSFDELFANQYKGGLEISEGPNDITVKADMPGLKASDIDIKLENGMLQIQGNLKEEVQDENRRYYSKTSRSYRYTVDLPIAVDESAIDAFYDDGVMQITIPKTEKTQAKKITVRESTKGNRESKGENQNKNKAKSW